ncbi:helix-turn-helix domain-containing protein [Nocardia sp. NPDC049220]|uniref:helix-turn-helix domain-containing protein n=1 Tax=Nocardia sp. NPDC049220 TaxID=3155273 RepID=UPI0033EECCEB
MARVIDRKPALTTERADRSRARAAGGESKAALAKDFGVSRETAYSYLRSGTDRAVTG